MKKITIALVMFISAMSFAQGNAELKAHYEAYYKQMKNHSENKTEIEVILFDFDGSVLARHPEQ